MKTIGLSYMAVWGDQYEDIASGDNFFLADLVNGLDSHGYKIYNLQQNWDGCIPTFKNFLAEERRMAYETLNFTDGFPELDILFVEWRWKMEGRNWAGENGSDKVQMDDYYRQQEILGYYHTNCPQTKIFIFDADGKLTVEDEEQWSRAEILTVADKTAYQSLRRPRLQIYWPYDSRNLGMQEHLIHDPYSFKNENVYCTDPNFLISYIGNNYDRDTQFQKYIVDVSRRLETKTVHIYGNWLKYPDKAMNFIEAYPEIMFHPKVTKAEMEYIYSRSICVPLLAKDSYSEKGHMTHRLLEAMHCGTLPVGFKEFYNIEKYVIDELIVSTTGEFVELILELANQTRQERIKLWKKQINHYQYTPDDFIHVLEQN